MKKTTKLGKKVKIQLIKLDMTQLELAVLLNTSPQNLNSVLTGKSSLNIEERLLIWLKEAKSIRRNHNAKR